MIVGYLKDEYLKLGLKIPISIHLVKKISSILIVGKSGSGKSSSMCWYLWSLLSSGESIVYISDMKGGEEYEAFEGSVSYSSGMDAIQMILDFYDFYVTVRENRIRLEKHYTLFIEEWASLLIFSETQSKKLRTELASKVAELLAVSRGLNLGVFLAVQRADATLFPQGAREQFQCVLSFGRCSAEQFRMLGFSSELEENPTQKYKAGQALALIDGQDYLYEIIVPWVKNQKEMCRGIRKYLDMQMDIPTLIRTTAKGRGRFSEEDIHGIV